MAPSGLLKVAGTKNFEAAVQSNFEFLNDSMAFSRGPTKRNGSFNTVVGPPTTGTWSLNAVWVDKHRSVWVCTSQGSPGGWAQFEPPILGAFPAGPILGYQVIRSDQNFVRYHWTGSAWVLVHLPITGGTLTGSLVLAGDPVTDLEAATKQYVDDFIGGTSLIGWFSVRTLIQLKAIASAGTNQFVFVKLQTDMPSLGRIYQFEFGDTTTEDIPNVIAPDDDGGRWFVYL